MICISAGLSTFHYLSSHFGANLSMGHPSIAIAINGFPPMAYTSLKALVAAIFQSEWVVYYGKKKSVVLIPVPFPISYAASSLVSLPTKRQVSSIFGLLDSNIVVNTFGDNLHPQPVTKTC
jgi:hypothetical protein